MTDAQTLEEERLNSDLDLTAFRQRSVGILINLWEAQTSLFCNEAAAAAAKSLQSCPTLCDPIYGSPSGPAIPGILQARVLERVAISFSNEASET